MNWRKGNEVIKNQLKVRAKRGELIPDVMRFQIILNTVCYKSILEAPSKELTIASAHLNW